MIMDSEHFVFRRFFELKKGDVFKFKNGGVFYTVLKKDDERETSLIQTSYGKLRNYQIEKEKFSNEVALYPEKQRGIK